MNKSLSKKMKLAGLVAVMASALAGCHDKASSSASSSSTPTGFDEERAAVTEVLTSSRPCQKPERTDVRRAGLNTRSLCSQLTRVLFNMDVGGGMSLSAFLFTWEFGWTKFDFDNWDLNFDMRLFEDERNAKYTLAGPSGTTEYRVDSSGMFRSFSPTDGSELIVPQLAGDPPGDAPTYLYIDDKKSSVVYEYRLWERFRRSSPIYLPSRIFPSYDILRGANLIAANPPSVTNQVVINRCRDNGTGLKPLSIDTPRNIKIVFNWSKTDETGCPTAEAAMKGAEVYMPGQTEAAQKWLFFYENETAGPGADLGRLVKIVSPSDKGVGDPNGPFTQFTYISGTDDVLESMTLSTGQSLKYVRDDAAAKVTATLTAANGKTQQVIYRKSSCHKPAEFETAVEYATNSSNPTGTPMVEYIGYGTHLPNFPADKLPRFFTDTKGETTYWQWFNQAAKGTPQTKTDEHGVQRTVWVADRPLMPNNPNTGRSDGLEGAPLQRILPSGDTDEVYPVLSDLYGEIRWETYQEPGRITTAQEENDQQHGQNGKLFFLTANADVGYVKDTSGPRGKINYLVQNTFEKNRFRPENNTRFAKGRLHDSLEGSVRTAFVYVVPENTPEADFDPRTRRVERWQRVASSSDAQYHFLSNVAMAYEADSPDAGTNGYAVVKACSTRPDLSGDETTIVSDCLDKGKVRSFAEVNILLDPLGSGPLVADLGGERNSLPLGRFYANKVIRDPNGFAMRSEARGNTSTLRGGYRYNERFRFPIGYEAVSDYNSTRPVFARTAKLTAGGFVDNESLSDGTTSVSHTFSYDNAALVSRVRTKLGAPASSGGGTPPDGEPDGGYFYVLDMQRDGYEPDEVTGSVDNESFADETTEDEDLGDTEDSENLCGCYTCGGLVDFGDSE